MGREHPEKEWWRERRVAPATFMGFPDVSKIKLRGGSLYTEQMDSVTLAVICDKCVQDGLVGEEYADVWEKLTQRGLQLCTRLHEPDLGYLFRAFCRADVRADSSFLPTFQGRIMRRLPYLELKECSVIIDAFKNPRFLHIPTYEALIDHVDMLLLNRDDFDTADLCGLLCVLPEERIQTRQQCEEHLLKRDVNELKMGDLVRLLDSVTGQNDLPDIVATTISHRLTELPAHEIIFAARGIKRLGVQIAGIAEHCMTHAVTMDIGHICECAYSLNLTDLSPLIAQHASVPAFKPMDCAYWSHICEGGDEFQHLKTYVVRAIDSFDDRSLTCLINGLSHSNMQDKRERRRNARNLVAGVALQKVHSGLESFDSALLPMVSRALANCLPADADVHRDILFRCVQAIQDDEGLTAAVEGVAGFLRAGRDGDDLARELTPRLLDCNFDPDQAARCLIALSWFPTFAARDDVAARLTASLGPLKNFSAQTLAGLAIAFGRTISWRMFIQKDLLSEALDMKRYDLPEAEIENVIAVWGTLGLQLE